MALARLKRRSQFLRVASLRRQRAEPGVLVQVAPQPAEDRAPGPRIGFTASRRVGGAVVRNRARRRLKAAIQRLAAHAPADLDLVLVARPATARRDFQALLGDLRAAMTRLGAWRDA